MPPEKEDWPVQWVVALTVVLLGAIVGLVFLIPRLIVAVGAAGGLAFGGAAASAAAVPWAVPLASAGLGLTGGSVLVLVLVRAAREATKEPYDWVVPIVGIIGGLTLDVAKEFALDNALVKIVLSAAVAFLMVVAGACYKKGGIFWRAVAALLIVAPPVYVLIQNLQSSVGTTLAASFHAVPAITWLRIGGFVLTGIAIGLLATLRPRSRA
jgi:hypothetical protein